MDLLKLLKDKSEYFTKKDSNSGISNVVTHIEIAEKHFENAKSGDDYLFNDVIYRTNQAFEGILKEAYIIINGSIPNNITPHKIEKYFDDNNVLEERVLQLFINYRTEWRNKSTHDYKLYFSEQESLLAIVNISAFINILLDQMVEKKSYNTQISMLKSSSKPIISSKNLLDKTVEFLKLFSKTIPSMMSGAAIPRISEREILGALNAYINNLDSSINVYHDYSIIKDNKVFAYEKKENNKKLCTRGRVSFSIISSKIFKNVKKIGNRINIRNN